MRLIAKLGIARHDIGSIVGSLRAWVTDGDKIMRVDR